MRGEDDLRLAAIGGNVAYDGLKLGEDLCLSEGEFGGWEANEMASVPPSVCE